MNVNSNKKNNFDQYVKNQVDQISYDFDENSWNELESHLNVNYAKKTSLSSNLNYKLLFFITGSLFLLLLCGGILYLLNSPKAAMEDIQHVSEPLNNPDWVTDAKDISTDSVPLDTIKNKKAKKVIKHKSVVIATPNHKTTQTKEDAVLKTESVEESKLETDTISKNDKHKKYIFW